jgi:hypothetical protein
MDKLRKILRLDRRRTPRYVTAIKTNFYVFDAVEGRPHTAKVPGRLSNISRKGACLQTDHVQIGNYHLLRDMERDGKTLLILDLPSSADGKTWSVQAKVLSYDRFVEKLQFQFDVRLQFVNLSEAAQQNLGALLKTVAVADQAESG